MNFFEWLDSRGYSVNTKKQYLYYFNKIERFGQPTQAVVDALFSRHPNAVFLAFLKVYLKDYLGIKGVKVPKIKGRVRKRRPVFLTYGEVQELVRAAETLELKLIIMIGFESGLRISETLGLTPYSIEKQTVVGKGNYEERIWIMNDTKDYLKQYIEDRAIGYRERIFKLDRVTVYRKLRRLSINVLGKEIGTHTLRHSCGRYLRVVKHWDIMKIKKFLRHRTITSTTIYSDATEEEIDAEMVKADES